VRNHTLDVCHKAFSDPSCFKGTLHSKSALEFL